MIEFKIEGIEGIQQNLDMMCVAVRDRILKEVLAKAAAPIVEAAKGNLASHTQTGTLAGSITFKVSSGRDKGVAAFCIIGPRTGIKVPVRVVTKGKNKGALMIAVPTYYAHLVEFGHKIVRDGNEIGAVGPIGFMRAAWDEYGGEVALFTIVEALVEGIETELSKTYRYK